MLALSLLTKIRHFWVSNFDLKSIRLFNLTIALGLQDGYIEGRPLWPMVYYCLRCGDLKSALNCMSMAG